VWFSQTDHLVRLESFIRAAFIHRQHAVAVFSATVCYKRGTSAIRLPGATSIFIAELHAILLALDAVRRSKDKHFILLSDSYSSLTALGGSHVDQDTIYKYLKTYSTLTNGSKTVILCWIPGHVGIPGNETADKVAKGALSLPVTPLKISVKNFLPRAKLLMRREWQEMWNCLMVTSFTLLIPQWVLPNRMVLSLGEMPSLSTGYRLVTRVLHMHIFLVMTTKQSIRSVSSLTVSHILLECSQFNHLRQQYHFGSTLKNLFNNTSVMIIPHFIITNLIKVALSHWCCRTTLQ